MVTGVQGMANVCYSFNALDGDDSLLHEVFSNDVLAWRGNFVDEDWHLLLSDRSLIQRSRVDISHLVGDHYGKHNGHEEIHYLRCLHHNYSQ